MSPKASLPILEMKVTLPPTRAAATDWFEPLPPGPILKPEPAMVSPITGSRPARNARSATKMPRMVTPPPAAMASTLIGRDEALFEDEAAIEPALAGLDDAVGLLGKVVEGEALDRAHRPGFALRRIDLLLHFSGDRQDLLRLADHLHTQG